MKTILETDEYAQWVDDLRDKRAQVKIDARVRRLSAGNPGDFKSLGDNVMEMRIDYGPGYRVYYTETGDVAIVLLAGGDKTSQRKDVEKAKQLAKKVRSDAV
jgi:putative addiction module killer protein